MFMRFFVVLLFALMLSSASSSVAQDIGVGRSKSLVIATSVGYPPFGFYEHGRLTGFDIRLAREVAISLGLTPVFKVMSFDDLWSAVDTGKADIAIATLTIDKDRLEKFDFSIPYYYEGIAAIYPNDRPVADVNYLQNKKIACQRNTLLSSWIDELAPKAHVLYLKSNDQLFEALRDGSVDVSIADENQGCEFYRRDKKLWYRVIAHVGQGYGILLKKNSPMTKDVNRAIGDLESSGFIDRLKTKWLHSCANGDDSAFASDT